VKFEWKKSDFIEAV